MQEERNKSLLADAADDAWKDFRKGVDEAWDELKHAVDEEKRGAGKSRGGDA